MENRGGEFFGKSSKEFEKEREDYEKEKEKYDLACDEAEEHAFGEPLSEEGKFFMEKVVDSHKRGGEKSWEERQKLYEDILKSSRLYGTGDTENMGFGQIPSIAHTAKRYVEAAGKFMNENWEYDINSGDPVGDIKKEHLALTTKQIRERKDFEYTRGVFKNIIRKIIKERLPDGGEDRHVF